MGAAKVSNSLESKWTVMNGAMKGSVRLMKFAEFTIGRSQECEFILTDDPKVSRRHASVKCIGDGCEVTSLNEKNRVEVNGREVDYVLLKSGDILKLGDTEIQFHNVPLHESRNAIPMNVPKGIELEMSPPTNPTYPAAPANLYSSPKPQQRPRPTPPRPQSQDNLNRLFIYGGLLLLGIWLFSGSPQKKKETDIRTEQQIQTDIEAAEKLRELSEQRNQKRQNGSLTTTQAQENYVRGFRDYKKGQYERAVVSFQACLALNPDHALCNRYLRLSQRKFNELIQYQMVLGRKYRDQNQYKSCRSAFRNVMVMVKDANSATYKEAKANYEACNSLVEGRF